MLHQQADAHHTHHAQTVLITNMPHQHAFTLVGHETVFGVHMTQYHHEEHKYQLVMKLGLPSEAAAAIAKARAQCPADTFMLCNDDSQLFMIPDLAAGRVRTFRANIFQGLPAFTDAEEAQPHFFPWAKTRTEPLVPDIEVTVERIVTYRPFDHHRTLPDFATYLLWGEGGEAHMTSLQTAHLASGPFEVPIFGPDFDHVMSLRAAPDWLDAPLLEAGIPVTVPALRLRDEQNGTPTIPCGVPFEAGETVTLLYRGIGAPLTVVAGHSPLAATAVCNSPGMDVCPGPLSLMMSPTPEDLMT